MKLLQALFLLLLVTNLGLFGWEQQRLHTAKKPDIVSPTPAGVQRLQLVSEWEAARQATAVKMPRDPIEGGGDVGTPAEEIGATEVVAPPPDSSAVQDSDRSRDPSKAAGESQLATGDQDDPGTETTVQVNEEPRAAVMEGSSEIDALGVEPDSMTDSDMGSQPSPESEGVELAATERCYTLGPVEKIAEAEVLGDQLESMAVDVTLRQEMQKKQIGFWVLIPSQGSRDRAQKKVEELKQAGVTDVWRFTKGDLANAISLGLFSRRGPAERRNSEVSKKGFNTEVQPRYIDESWYWFDFRRANEAAALTSQIDALLARDYPGVKLSTAHCPSIATR